MAAMQLTRHLPAADFRLCHQPTRLIYHAGRGRPSASKAVPTRSASVAE